MPGVRPAVIHAWGRRVLIGKNNRLDKANMEVFMGSQVKWVFVLVMVLLFSPGYSHAIGLPWSTTFKYGPCSQRGGGGQTDCASVTNDGIYWSWGASGLSGNYTQVATGANNPSGGGGNGFRAWVGDGVNAVTGQARIDFPSAQKEIWARWYERWESGTKWGPLNYSKSLYFYSGGTSAPYTGFVYDNQYRIYNQGSVGNYPQGTGGWATVYPGGVSDGTWHCYEVHMKMDTNSSDGIGQIWVDGKLVSSLTNVNWSNGNSSSRNGWTWLEFKSNQSSLSTGKIAYVDFDDMAIYNSTPPNRDAQGNPFIGPLGSVAAPSDSTAPTVTSFTMPATATSLTVPISTFSVADSAALASAPYCVTTTNSSSGCAWSSTVPSAITFSSAGTQTAYAWARDAAGNISNASTVSVTINVPISGACGSSSGRSFTALTSTSANLCSSGTVASFAGTGPWTWGCTGSGGGTSTSATACSASVAASTAGSTLFSEGFENNSYSSRGWYDNTNHGTIVSGGQSGNCLQWAWGSGATTPTNGGSMRMKFTPTDSLYLSYYVKFQTGWRGSQKAYHPHMLYLLSDLDLSANIYSPLANNYLTTYVEFLSDVGSPYAIRPQLAIQDQKRVNTSSGTPPNNLTATTENRSVAYCNTPVSSGATGTCYADNPYYSANTWKASNVTVAPNEWHHVEVYFKMNSVSGGKGQSDGIMQEWIDGVQVINRSDVLYRTNQDANKKWALFVLAPYIGDGSPIAQSMWIDELEVGTASPYSAPSVPAPSGLKIKLITP